MKRKEYPEVLTVVQVADFLQIDPQSVYKMAQRSKIPCTKIAGQWRFKKSILDEWLTQKITKREVVKIYEGPVKITGQNSKEKPKHA